MWDRFTDRARKVMQLANQEAQRCNHEYVGTEHVLLGLVKEGNGVAANVLKRMGVDIGNVRLAIEQLVKPGPEMVTIGKLPLTPRAKRVLELAMENARSLGVNYVGTEAILLGLIEEEGVAGSVLNSLGATKEKVREGVLALLGKGADHEGISEPTHQEGPPIVCQTSIRITETVGGVQGAVSVLDSLNTGKITAAQAQVLFEQFFGLDSEIAKKMCGQQPST